MHTTLNKTLEKIYFTEQNGLVFCNKLEDTKHISEKYHVQGKCKKLRVTAVLFRRTYDENLKIVNSKPALYIFHDEANDLPINGEKHKELHAKIWSAGEIDIYFIVSKATIDIFNARKPAQRVEDEDDLNLDDLLLVSSALKEFNDQRFLAIIFGKGIFWEQDDFLSSGGDDKFSRNQLSEENLPFHQLLTHLLDARQHLHQHEKELSNETIDKLLIICILVKFLEEIRDENGKYTVEKIYKFRRVKNFADALEKGVCIGILEDLAKQFNGKIFDQFNEEEKKKIEQTSLQAIADFLNGNLDIPTKQLFLWKQYSFNYLPVELISSIYENFLPKEKGVVYTPPFLVNFLIDEVMPLDKAGKYFSTEQFSTLDASCGSGVFLVSAYKRMLQWWSVNQYEKTGEIKFPSKRVCQNILKNNIFGVDIESKATLITIFSLTIALLDKLDPKEVWSNLKLDNLRENIKNNNFFKWVNNDQTKQKQFDLVIGNPPFNPKTGTSKKDAVSEEQLRLFGIKNKDIPNNNFALKFLEGAMFLGKEICLIVPSNVLLYNKADSAQRYRNRLFTKFTIEKIFDYTHLRRTLFGSADTPVCAIMAKTSESDKKNIEHVVIKRIAPIEKKIIFEIDYYDRHFVQHDWAIDKTKQFIWKTNLLGGGRVFHLIYRLSLLPTLKDFINSKTNWKEVRGFEGGGNLVLKNQDRIISISEASEPEIKRNVDIYSDNLKPQVMYQPPFMVLDQVLGENSLPACLILQSNKLTAKAYLYYNRDFIGIRVPEKDEDILKRIYDLIRLKKNKNQLNYQLYLLAISSSSLVLTETDINKSEILSVPFPPENEKYLELSETEKILQEDVLEYYVHLGKAISKKGQGKKLHEKASHNQLKKFGDTFCGTLNPIYSKNNKSWQPGKFSQTHSFTICQFSYGKNGGLSFQPFDKNELDSTINSLIYDNTSNRGAIFTRVCRLYKNLNGYDCVFLIKPNAVRYWLDSIALHDADETFMDLKEAGR